MINQERAIYKSRISECNNVYSEHLPDAGSKAGDWWGFSMSRGRFRNTNQSIGAFLFTPLSLLQASRLSFTAFMFLL